MSDMTQAELEAAVKASLAREQLWQELVAPNDRGRDVYRMLENFRRSAKNQKDARRAAMAEANAQMSQGEISKYEYNERLREYHSWKRRIANFTILLNRRYDELSERFADQTISAERRRQAAATTMMHELALAIYDHQAEEITDAGLYAVLDRISADFGKCGRMTLREALDAEVIYHKEFSA